MSSDIQAFFYLSRPPAYQEQKQKEKNESDDSYDDITEE